MECRVSMLEMDNQYWCSETSAQAYHFILVIHAGPLLYKLFDNIHMALGRRPLQRRVPSLGASWSFPPNMVITPKYGHCTQYDNLVQTRFWCLLPHYNVVSVLLTKSCREMSQPARMRAATVSPWPPLAAWCRAVWPSWEFLVRIGKFE